MFRWSALCAVTLWLVASSSSEPRTLHRLIGGHLRIFHEDREDVELLTALASGSKNRKNRKGDDEDKKTLAQQVADGKYGLIQKELFAKPSKRPGVISYDGNPETPADNVKNLGGLTKNDIWLAENHLLVLKGGTYALHDNEEDVAAPSWPAIDDYKAPSRQVKIPSHPKIPPPFPVQLADDGPLQILGTNSSRTLNGTFDQTAHAVLPPQGYEPGTGPFFPPLYPHPPNATSGQAPLPIPPHPPGDHPPGVPFPPFQLNGTLPPFFASLPPGAAILPPPSQSETFDEDDPSIYYPPPYSFYYPKDNSSAVPAGPLVPGIVLPPPPNFFGPLEETTARKPPRHRTKTTTTPLPHLRPTATALPPTSVVHEKTTKKPVRILPVEINNELKPAVTTVPPKLITIPTRTYPSRTQKTRPPSVTVLKPVKHPSYVYNNEVYRSVPRVKAVISTTQVYYSTTKGIETNSIASPPEKFHIGNGRRPKTTTKSPAQYYYYEEEKPTTRRPYFDIPKEYYVPAKQQQQQQQPKFIYVTTRPYDTQRPRYRFVQTPNTDSYGIHIARLQNQIHQYYTTPRPIHTSRPIYQFSFEAANYRPPSEDDREKFRPLPKYSVEIQPAIEIVPTEASPTGLHRTTPKPDHDYEEDREKAGRAPTPRPISQYSFEATPSPIYREEGGGGGFFDDNAKQYFTTFGRKIPSGVTAPIPGKQANLEGDTAVNYLPPRPTVNPEAEFVPDYPQVVKYPSGPVRYAQQSDRDASRSYISYQLPGDDGAHFYFLTPQLAQSREQGAGYYYSQANAPSRIRRGDEDR